MRQLCAWLLLGLVACISPKATKTPLGGRAVSGTESASPRAVLSRFVTAVESEDWNGAYALLSARWRGQLSPSRLATDYADSGTVGRTAAVRVKALLAGGAELRIKDRSATLVVGEGRTAALLEEEGGWKVEALE